MTSCDVAVQIKEREGRKAVVFRTQLPLVPLLGELLPGQGYERGIHSHRPGVPMAPARGRSGSEAHVLGPLGVDPLVEGHADGVLLAQRAIKDALHAAVGADLRGWGRGGCRCAWGREAGRLSARGGGAASEVPSTWLPCLAAGRQQAGRYTASSSSGAARVQRGAAGTAGAHRLADAPAPPRLGPQFHRSEPAHVVGVVEHEAHHGLGLMHLRGGHAIGRTQSARGGAPAARRG